MDNQHIKNYRSNIEGNPDRIAFPGLIYALFDVLKVFLGIFTFALIFAVSFSKPFEKLVAFLRGRRR